MAKLNMKYYKNRRLKNLIRLFVFINGKTLRQNRSAPILLIKPT